VDLCSCINTASFHRLQLLCAAALTLSFHWLQLLCAAALTLCHSTGSSGSMQQHYHFAIPLQWICAAALALLFYWLQGSVQLKKHSVSSTGCSGTIAVLCILKWTKDLAATSHSTLYGVRKLVTVHCKNQTKYINNARSQNEMFLVLQHVVHRHITVL
jgi:uncharacterized membrane protein